MTKGLLMVVVAGSALGAAAAAYAQASLEPRPPLGFFVTSTTSSGNLGGLAGADAQCQRLAAAVGAGSRTWRAYLSTHGTATTPAVNARDRIGNGPWYNANGVLIAGSLPDLHGDIQRDTNLIFQVTAVTEKGDVVPDTEHDMLTGSTRTDARSRRVRRSAAASRVTTGRPTATGSSP